VWASRASCTQACAPAHPMPRPAHASLRHPPSAQCVCSWCCSRGILGRGRRTAPCNSKPGQAHAAQPGGRAGTCRAAAAERGARCAAPHLRHDDHQRRLPDQAALAAHVGARDDGRPLPLPAQLQVVGHRRARQLRIQHGVPPPADGELRCSVVLHKGRPATCVGWGAWGGVGEEGGWGGAGGRGIGAACCCLPPREARGGPPGRAHAHAPARGLPQPSAAGQEERRGPAPTLEPALAPAPAPPLLPAHLHHPGL
jgi:hypothetical protein